MEEAPESPDSSLEAATVEFNATGLWGYAKFAQTKTVSPDFDGSLEGMSMDVEYKYDKAMYPEGVGTPVKWFEFHEFPVPEDGDCSAVGGIYPSEAAGRYKTRVQDATSTDLFSSGALLIDADGGGVESLYYDGITPTPPNNAAGSGPAVQLLGTSAIQGRSFVLVADPDCRANDPADAALCSQSSGSEDACNGVADSKCTWVSEAPACGTVGYSGAEWKTLANFTEGKGLMGGKIRGGVKFSQVTTRGSESDTTIYIELEATDDWDFGTPQDNGCSDTEADSFVSCGHKMHIHERKMDIATNALEACNTDSTGGHFNVVAGRQGPGSEFVAGLNCNEGADGSIERANSCETGDITGKFIPNGLNIGKKGSPAKYFFVDTYDKMHSIVLKGSGSDISLKSVVMHEHSRGASRTACADIPIAYPWATLVGR
jgi:hypothetical protein